MTAETDTRLLYMANQIARNFEALGQDNAMAATADHMLTFWDPRMKDRIVALAAEQAETLSPIAAAAVARLRSGEEPAHQTGATRFAAVDEPGRSDAG
ncbi:MAG: formate dehydrogenase subunit delta [Rhizorhabdus sp.]